MQGTSSLLKMKADSVYIKQNVFLNPKLLKTVKPS